MFSGSATSLLLGLLFSSIGVGYFMYGRKQQKLVPLLSGIGLVGYTFFVSNSWALAAIGVLLMALPYFIQI
ncbi:MAG: amino acid transport protein [Stenotrophobium sp.]